MHRVRPTDRRATVRLRLPTFFCSPNFSWLMVADAHDAVSAVPGVTRADIALEDHFVSEVINQGVAARSGFVAAFPGEAVQSSTTCVRPSTARPHWPARSGWPGRWSTPAHARGAGAAAARAGPAVARTSTGCGPAGPRWGCRTTTTRPLLLHPDGEAVTAAAGPAAPAAGPAHGREHRGERRHVPRPAREAVRGDVLKKHHGPAGTPPRRGRGLSWPLVIVAAGWPCSHLVGSRATLLRTSRRRLGLRPPHRTRARRFGGIRPL